MRRLLGLLPSLSVATPQRDEIVLVSAVLRLLVMVSVWLVAAPAQARECDLMSVEDVGMGFVIPTPGCSATIHGDVGFGLGDTFPNRRPEQLDALDVRLFAELGVLLPVEGTRRFEMGPVVSIAGLNSARDGEFDRISLSGLLHTRVWFADDILTFDTSLGPSANWRGSSLHPGLFASIVPGVHGVAGLELSYDFLPFSNEHRVMGGLRMTWGAAVAAIGCALGSRCAG